MPKSTGAVSATLFALLFAATSLAQVRTPPTPSAPPLEEDDDDQPQLQPKPSAPPLYPELHDPLTQPPLSPRSPGNPSAPPFEDVNAAQEDARLRELADALASQAAADVVRRFGGQEHFIFQFLSGFRESVVNGNQAMLQDSRSKGFSAGRDMASRIAESKMPEIARKHAISRAEQDALERHRKAVNQGRVDTAVRIPRARLDQEEIRKLGVMDRTEQSFKDEIKALHDRLYSSWQVKNTFKDVYQFKLRVDLEKLLSGKDTSSDWSPFNNMDAWSSVKKPHLSPSQTLKLRRAFDAAFNKKLPELMNQTFSYPLPEAIQLGREFGWEIQWRKAGQEGFRQAFDQLLIERSSQAYEKEFAPVYTQRFNQSMEEIQNRVALELAGTLKLSPEGDNLLDFSGAVTNFGGATAAPDSLKISGPHLQLMRALQTPSINGHTQIDVASPSMIRFNGDLVPGVEYTFTMALHGKTSNAVFSIAFSDSLAAFDRAKTPQEQDALRRAIIKSISNEWDDARGIFKSNIYANELDSPDVSRLGLLVVHAKRNPQSQVHTFAQELKSMSRSMWYIYIFKNRSYNNLVDQLAATHK